MVAAATGGCKPHQSNPRIQHILFLGLNIAGYLQLMRRSSSVQPFATDCNPGKSVARKVRLGSGLLLSVCSAFLQSLESYCSTQEGFMHAAFLCSLLQRIAHRLCQLLASSHSLPAESRCYFQAQSLCHAPQLWRRIWYAALCPSIFLVQSFDL